MRNEQVDVHMHRVWNRNGCKEIVHNKGGLDSRKIAVSIRYIYVEYLFRNHSFDLDEIV